MEALIINGGGQWELKKSEDEVDLHKAITPENIDAAATASADDIPKYKKWLNDPKNQQKIKNLQSGLRSDGTPRDSKNKRREPDYGPFGKPKGVAGTRFGAKGSTPMSGDEGKRDIEAENRAYIDMPVVNVTPKDAAGKEVEQIQAKPGELPKAKNLAPMTRASQARTKEERSQEGKKLSESIAIPRGADHEEHYKKHQKLLALYHNPDIHPKDKEIIKQHVLASQSKLDELKERDNHPDRIEAHKKLQQLIQLRTSGTINKEDLPHFDRIVQAHKDKWGF